MFHPGLFYCVHFLNTTVVDVSLSNLKDFFFFHFFIINLALATRTFMELNVKILLKQDNKVKASRCGVKAVDHGTRKDNV